MAPVWTKDRTALRDPEFAIKRGARTTASVSCLHPPTERGTLDHQGASPSGNFHLKDGPSNHRTRGGKLPYSEGARRGQNDRVLSLHPVLGPKGSRGSIGAGKNRRTPRNTATTGTWSGGTPWGSWQGGGTPPAGGSAGLGSGTPAFPGRQHWSLDCKLHHRAHLGNRDCGLA